MNEREVEGKKGECDEGVLEGEGDMGWRDGRTDEKGRWR